MLLEHLKSEVEANLNNAQFGVEELAKNVGLSRAQLHRKLNEATGQSVSQFIREYRLKRGMELLQEGKLTATQVANQVGFGSATYFSKCFNEFYGFPPGEAKTRGTSSAISAVETSDATKPMQRNPIRRKVILTGALVLITIAALVFLFKINDTNAVADIKAEKSIAILPFRNLSKDPQNEYFGEGVIEAIRTNLSQVKDIRVLSRTSVEQFRQTNKSAREIANELGVSTLMEGSIQRNDNKVRIDVYLVDGKTQEQIWAKNYDRELKDVFTIQTEIAQQVADELRLTLSAEEKTKLGHLETTDPKAYDLYLKAIYEFRTYTNRGIHNSIDLLKEAIKLDPNYARAYASLANSYVGLATIFGAELSALDAFAMGKPLIDKAISLDPHLDLAGTVMGFYRLYNDWDFKGAEEVYKIGVRADHPDAIALYSDYLNFMQRHEEALKWARHLNALDPYYPNSRMVYSLVFNNRFDEAVEFSESRLKTFNNYNALDAHGFLMLNMERYDEAIEYFKKAIELEGIRYPRMLGWMGAAYAHDGQRAKAKEILDELKSRLDKKGSGSIPFFIAVIHAALNEKSEALTWLRKSYESHDMEIPWLVTEPQFKILHQEPAFIELATSLGFPNF